MTGTDTRPAHRPGTVCPDWCAYHAPDSTVHVGEIIRCGDGITVTPVSVRYPDGPLADLNYDAVSIDAKNIPLDIAPGLAEIFTKIGKTDIADAIRQAAALLTEGGEPS